jgi:aryl-alcohol dehydrogenase-like predicted oxidoreductase
MIVNKLGNTGICLSAIGLGAWAIGGGGYQYGWGEQDDNDSIATIHRAVELGINWIDTAPVYGLGHSETVVGQAIKGLRDKIVISTKCGFRWDEDKKIFNSLKKESIKAEVEESLKRLNIDVIDLYMIHKPRPEEDIEEAWAVLADLVKEGKVRYAGVSSFSAAQLQRIQPVHPVAFLQPGYSMLDPSIEEEILGYCAANNMGVIVYSPMYSGLLTGKFTKEKAENLPADDFRRLLDNFKEPYLGVNLGLVERLREIAERHHRTAAQLAIAWVLRRPEVTSAIVGARRPSQIEETVPAGDWVLSEEDKTGIEQILKEHHALLKEFKVECSGS